MSLVADLDFDLGVVLGSTNDDIWAEMVEKSPGCRALRVHFSQPCRCDAHSVRAHFQSFFEDMRDDIIPRIVEGMALYDGRSPDEIRTGLHSLMAVISTEIGGAQPPPTSFIRALLEAARASRSPTPEDPK